MNRSVFFFLALILLLGTTIVHDYGISMDEPIERKHGIVAFDYLNERFGLFPSIEKGTGENLQSYDHRDYGMIFQLVAYGLELLLGINNSRDVFFLRHLLVFLLFWSSLLFFFKIIVWQYGNWRLGIFGIAILWLSPRIFADAFYNPKDIPLLSFSIIATYTMLVFLHRPSAKSALGHGLACGLVISTRVVGVIFPALTFVMVLAHLSPLMNSSVSKRSWAISTAFLLLSLLLFTWLFWPALWHQPLESFWYAFQSMKKFRWYGHMLFMGEMVYSHSLPWYYAPIWIIVTTPLAILLFFGAGLTDLIRKFLLQKLKFFKSSRNTSDLLFLALFTAPILAVILFGSALYNGWRHLYFVYPFFVLIGIRGLVVLFAFFRKRISENRYRILASALAVLVALDLGSTVLFLAKYHPHQSVYFNELALDVERNFERDYYGMSYRKTMEFLLEYSKKDSIRIYSHDFIGKINTMYFPKKDARRFHFVEKPQDADYFVSLLNPRNQQEQLEITKKLGLYSQPEIFNVSIKGYRVIGVFVMQVPLDENE
jgi:hypothetical protein